MTMEGAPKHYCSTVYPVLCRLRMKMRYRGFDECVFGESRWLNLKIVNLISQSVMVFLVPDHCPREQNPSQLLQSSNIFFLQKTFLCLGIDLGVDPNKSTPVDLVISSRVGSFLLTATDPKSNFVERSHLKLFLPHVDLNRLETQTWLNLSLQTNDSETGQHLSSFCSVFKRMN
jgi:hypothetical protein